MAEENGGNGGYVPPSGAEYGTPLVDLRGILQPTDYYHVLSVSQITRYPKNGREIPTMDVLFEIPGYPGVHELYIDNYAFLHASPERDLRGRSKRIKRLYDLPNPGPEDPEEL